MRSSALVVPTMLLFGAMLVPSHALDAQAAGYGQGDGVVAASSQGPTPGAVTFKVRVENLSRGAILEGSGGKAPFALAPGLWVVHSGDNPVFSAGEPAGKSGLEPLAEDGAPFSLAGALESRPGVVAVGVYNTPLGAAEPGPAGPGAAYEFTVSAPPGARLSLAEMFGQSNDLFYGNSAEGIRLFDRAGNPVSGDVTGDVELWDAGTEVNQEPGFGPDQAPRQAAPDTGRPENRPVGPVEDAFRYPATKAVLRVTVAPAG